MNLTPIRWDGFLDDFFNTKVPTKRKSFNFMDLDIKATDKNYLVNVDLPGCKKEDLNLELDNGYLTISAERMNEKDESTKNYIHRERYFGKTSRSIYVGSDVSIEDIKAKFENGSLTITIPKEDEEEIESRKNIEIE